MWHAMAFVWAVFVLWALLMPQLVKSTKLPMLGVDL